MKKRIFYGQSLFEIIFVIAITALILTGVVSLSAVSVRNSDASSNKTLSSKYLREATDFLRMQRDTNWASFSARASDAGITWCLIDLVTWPASNGACATTDFISGTNNLFREVILSFPNPTTRNKVNARISVKWSDSQGTHEDVINTSYVNWDEAGVLYE